VERQVAAARERARARARASINRWFSSSSRSRLVRNLRRPSSSSSAPLAGSAAPAPRASVDPLVFGRP